MFFLLIILCTYFLAFLILFPFKKENSSPLESGKFNLWSIGIESIDNIGLITPPVGLNVFVIHTAFPKIPSGDIFRQLGAFLISDFFVILFIVIFPVITIIFSRIF